MLNVCPQSNTAQLARLIRRHVVTMASVGGGSHVASGLSIADILAVLYGSVLHHNPADPRDEGRDRVILSKGHAGAAMYAVLAECGYFPVEDLQLHYADGSKLSGHVSHLGVPGVELSTGSLGHGLSVGVGMALAARRRARPFRVFVILSDGECDEGSIWEAAMFAGFHRLATLVAIVDYNKLQSLDTTTATLDLEPFAEKWSAFGWDVTELDGHDQAALGTAMKSDRATHGKPQCLIAHTVKGKGVPFMEDTVLWHYRSPNPSELMSALDSLAEDAS